MKHTPPLPAANEPTPEGSPRLDRVYMSDREFNEWLRAYVAKSTEPLEREISRMHQHHLRDEAMILLRTDELRATIEQLAAARAELASWKDCGNCDAPGLELELKQARADLAEVVTALERGYGREPSCDGNTVYAVSEGEREAWRLIAKHATRPAAAGGT